MENKKKKREFIVFQFQFKVLNLFGERREIITKFNMHSWGKLGYFEKLDFDPDVKSKDLLDNDQILLFVAPQEYKVWLWEGCNTTEEMGALAEKRSLPIREHYGTDLPRGVVPYLFPISPHLIPQPPLSILRCTKCGYNKIEIRKEDYPLCIRYGYSGGDFRSSYP
jgi:hypothetical protein